MRKLWIGTNVLRFVSGNVARIEALAFAILIKQHRINSEITDASLRRLKEEFGCGYNTLRRAVANGLDSGFLRKEGNSLIANRLHDNLHLSYCLKARFFVDAVNNCRKHKLSLQSVIKIIEVAITVNQVCMIQDCADTHERATSGQSVRAIRNARKRESRMLRGTSYNEDFVGLSNLQIQKLIGKKAHTAIRVVKQAILQGLIEKRWRMKFINTNGDPCNFVTANYVDDAKIIVSLRHRSVFERTSNVYSTKSCLVMRTNNA